MGSILDAIELVSEGLGSIGKEVSKKGDVLLSNGSMGSFLENFIITPRIVISNTLRDNDDITNIIDLNMDTFVTMYTRTFDILLRVYGYDQQFALRTLGSGTTFTLESESEVLGEVSLEDCASKCTFPLDLSLEDNKINIATREVELSATVIDKDKGTAHDFKLTVLVRASIVYTDSVDIKEAIDTNGDRVSFSYRLDEYRSGLISLNNLIFSNDLIKKYKKSRLKDKGDFLKEIEVRRRKNVKSLSIRQTVDFSKMYQMIIISKSELKIAEKILGGKIDKNRFKDKLLNNTLSMAITVMDDDYEMVDVYLEGIPDKLELSYKSLRKGDKSDTNDVLKWMISQR